MTCNRDSLKRISLRRYILFRLLAVAMGLSALLLLEGLLRLTDLGRVPDLGDPFVGFSEVRPLFVLNDQGDRFEIPVSRQAFFQPESFAANKGPAEFRVFCLGGSTVQGRPYSIETSFTTWLELSLKAADPSRDWEVVNCGGVSYASYRLLPIMKEILAYEPDLFIIYTGHNEFLEARTYSLVKKTPAWIKGTYTRLSRLRLFGLLQRLWRDVRDVDSTRDALERAKLSAEVDALLDYRGGLEKYHRDDDWRRGVIQHFDVNLRRMIRIAGNAQIPIVIANPVSNLRDTPPFKTEHRRGLTHRQIDQFEGLWEEAKALDWSRLDEKAARLQEALAIDNRHAEAHFLLAKVYDSMGNASQAKNEYLRAKDEDICPLRILEPMHEIILQVTDQTGTRLVDVRQMFEKTPANGIPGDEQLIDHVHPKIEGHQRIAQMLREEMVRWKMLTLQPDWQARQKDLYAARWRTLASNYFPEGIARLKGLQRWTQGRVSRLRLTDDEVPLGDSTERK